MFVLWFIDTLGRYKPVGGGSGSSLTLPNAESWNHYYVEDSYGTLIAVPYPMFSDDT